MKKKAELQNNQRCFITVTSMEYLSIVRNLSYLYLLRKFKLISGRDEPRMIFIRNQRSGKISVCPERLYYDSQDTYGGHMNYYSLGQSIYPIEMLQWTCPIISDRIEKKTSAASSS
ncbi:hypothetical protein WUBG_03372 [Wuchereria bancrofti]|uniref:Uncharacterized protein n=1 Tax=Wuchereria bancrofti TaxID=6293 RepID=J9BER1_WUCBA|nr:hypothetical protein WUBG_03372 [Wuchereria bancrofti]